VAFKSSARGFLLVSPDKQRNWAFGTIDGGQTRHIRDYSLMRDLTASRRGVMVIDSFRLSCKQRFPCHLQHVLDNVKTGAGTRSNREATQKTVDSRRTRRDMRPAPRRLAAIHLATVETDEHRHFPVPGPPRIARHKLFVALPMGTRTCLAIPIILDCMFLLVTCGSEAG